MAPSEGISGAIIERKREIEKADRSQGRKKFRKKGGEPQTRA